MSDPKKHIFLKGQKMYDKNKFIKTNPISILTSSQVLWEECKFVLPETTINTAIILTFCYLCKPETHGSDAILPELP